MKHRVFCTDTGHTGEVTPAAFLRYFQQAAGLQMLTERPSYAELHERGWAFVLSRIHLQCYAAVREYEHLTVQTWTCNEKGASFGRAFRVLRGDETVAEAMTVWALVDVAEKRLISVREADVHYGGDDPPDLSCRFVMPRVMLSEGMTRRVLYEDVDVNGHLNNARYADWLCSAVPDMDKKTVCDMQLHYVKEAKFGEAVTIYHGEADDGKTMVFESRLSDGSCNVRAVLRVR